MGRCEKCIEDRKFCINCRENPIYRDVPKISLFKAYKPACPKGEKDCVCDPAYIKYAHPKLYKELYGDMSPEDAVKKDCDPEDLYCYDDEDK